MLALYVPLLLSGKSAVMEPTVLPVLPLLLLVKLASSARLLPPEKSALAVRTAPQAPYHLNRASLDTTVPLEGAPRTVMPSVNQVSSVLHPLRRVLVVRGDTALRDPHKNQSVTRGFIVLLPQNAWLAMSLSTAPLGRQARIYVPLDTPVPPQLHSNSVRMARTALKGLLRLPYVGKDSIAGIRLHNKSVLPALSAGWVLYLTPSVPRVTSAPLGRQVVLYATLTITRYQQTVLNVL